MPIYFGEANNNGGCGFHFAMTLTSIAECFDKVVFFLKFTFVINNTCIV